MKSMLYNNFFKYHKILDDEVGYAHNDLQKNVLHDDDGDYVGARCDFLFR